MEKVFNYVAPEVEIVEVQVEKGYSSSTPGMEENPENPWA